jgi:Sec-independent protein translocase protein TatA
VRGGALGGSVFAVGDFLKDRKGAIALTGSVEILIIIGVLLLLFGPALIPKLARQMGELWKSTRELKDSLPNADDFKIDQPSKPKKDK